MRLPVRRTLEFQMIHLRPLLVPTILAVCSLLLTACGGPRMKVLDEGDFRSRPRNYPIDVYVGKVLESHREIAVIDSTGYSRDDEVSREREMDELKRKARALGGDAIHDVRLLTKKIKGYTIDERTPFPSWKQGEYPLYFMRGVVIAYESGLPGAVSKGTGFTDSPVGYVPAGQKAEFSQLELGEPEDEETVPPAREPESVIGVPEVEIPKPPAEPQF